MTEKLTAAEIAKWRSDYVYCQPTVAVFRALCDMASASLASAGDGEVEGLIEEAATAIWNHLRGNATEAGTDREVIERHINRALARQQAEIAKWREGWTSLADINQEHQKAAETYRAQIVHWQQQHTDAVFRAQEAEAEIASLRERVEKAEGERDAERALVQERERWLEHWISKCQATRSLQLAADRRAAELQDELDQANATVARLRARVAELTRVVEAAAAKVHDFRCRYAPDEADAANTLLRVLGDQLHQALTAAQGEEPAPDHTAAIREAMGALEAITNASVNVITRYDKHGGIIRHQALALRRAHDRARAAHAKLTEIIGG